jgi:hypothetical protein
LMLAIQRKKSRDGLFHGRRKEGSLGLMGSFTTPRGKLSGDIFIYRLEINPINPTNPPYVLPMNGTVYLTVRTLSFVRTTYPRTPTPKICKKFLAHSLPQHMGAI